MGLKKDKENIIKLIKWGVILIVAILLTTCGTNLVKDLIKANKPTPDTVKIHTIDTIFPPKEPIQFKYIKIPTPYIVHDTIININGEDTCTNVKIYEDSLDDSNITIRYKDYVSQGTLIGKDLDYTLKVPLRIVDSQTTTIKVPTLYPPTFQLGVGLTVGSNIFAPEIGVSYKRHTLSLGYNLTNKQPTAGYKFVLFRK